MALTSRGRYSLDVIIILKSYLTKTQEIELDVYDGMLKYKLQEIADLHALFVGKCFKHCY